MFIIGLTGSIGMGKSTAAAMFKRLNVPVQDADAAVHRLMGRGGAAVDPVEARFPGVTVDGAVDRRALGSRVFGDLDALKELEGILHPLVARDRENFLRIQALHGLPLAVLDVPLLFETGGDRKCDSTVLVTAPDYVQKARVMKRPGMTADKLGQILAKQMPDREKRARADHVLETGLGKRPVWIAIQGIVRECARRQGRHWPRVYIPR